MGALLGRRRSSAESFGAWFLLACFATASVARGQDDPQQANPQQANPKQDKQIVRISGTVRDASNRPVPDATVWLVEPDLELEGVAELLSESKSGADGAFSFFEVVGKSTWLHLIARDSRGRLGWNSGSVGPGINSIRLRDARDLRGRVIDADGRPIAGARVVPRSFFRPASNQTSSAWSAELFPALRTLLEGHTDKDGGFSLPQIPEQVLVRCEISAPGFGSGYADLDFKAPVVVKLERPGTISGALAPLQGAEAARGGYKLRLTRQLKELEPGAMQPIIVSHSEVVTTNDQGAFRCDGLPPGQYSIAAIQGQGRSIFAHPTTYAEVKPGETTAGISVPVVPTVRLTGRVIGRETQKGVENVEIFGYPFEPSPNGHRRIDEQAATTDAEGRFELRLPPGKMRVFVSHTPPEYLVPRPDTQNTPREIANDDEWPTFELSRAVQVEGVVLDEQGQPAPHAELHIDLYRRNGRVYDWLPGMSDGDGKLTIRQVDPEVRFSLRARTRDAVTQGFVLVTGSELKGPTELKISKEYVFRLHGKVVDETGLPVPEAKVSLEWERSAYGVSGDRPLRSGPGGPQPRFLDHTRKRSELAELAADVDGKFASPVLWPGDNYQVIVAAPGYAELKTSAIEGVAGGVHDFGALTMKRNDLVVAGAVVDEEGREIAGAEIQVVIPGRAPKPPLRSDERGRFSITGIDASLALPLRARTAAATTNGATVVLPADFSKPVTLVVSAKHAFRLRGTILDQHGKPAPGARASVVWDRRAVQQPVAFGAARREIVDNTPVTLDQITAGADGGFETPALWPDEDYHLVAAAPSYDSVPSAPVFGTAGEITALEPLALTRNDLEIRGRVVDSTGRALEGATVLNSGDAAHRLVAATDAEGRFALSGLYEGPAYLLARKPGYRAAGWRGAAGGDSIEIVLLSSDEPRRQVALAKIEDADRFATGQKLARRLLVDLWALRERFDDNPHNQARSGRGRRASSGSQSDTAARLAKLMARIDLAQALSWSAAEAGRLDEVVRVEAVAGDFENDVDRALMLLAGLKTPAARSALLDMARREITAGKRESAIRLLEAALDTAPMANAASPAADVASAQAEIAPLAIQAGAANWGEKLLFAAADAAEKLDAQIAPQARGEAVVALAPVDPDRALRLLKTFDPQMNYDYAPRAIAALEPRNTNRAREFLNLLQSGVFQSWMAADGARTPVAYQLAARDLNAAMQVVAEMNEQDASIKADTLGLMALAVAPRDRTQANALVDQALDLLLDAPGFYTTSYGGRPVDGARVALVAKKFGYPDLPSVIDRVLALRSTARGMSTAARRAETTVNLAKALALVDPATSRELLNSCEADARFLGDSENSPYSVRRVGRGDWLQAWAMVDFGEAERRSAEELARLRTQAKIETASIALLPLLELLVVPPSERTRFVIQSINPSYWFPDDWR